MMNEMNLNEYKALYDEVVRMSIDADGFGLFDEINEEDIEKAKWIACIIECMNDVPLRRVKHIFPSLLFCVKKAILRHTKYLYVYIIRQTAG